MAITEYHQQAVDLFSPFNHEWCTYYLNSGEGMGFYFARPTTFKNPMFQVEKVDYYAVDHTPSYFWESASRSISAALVFHLPAIAAGPEGWQKNETIRRAINIDNGVIQKPDILAYQRRQQAYPHLPI